MHHKVGLGTEVQGLGQGAEGPPWWPRRVPLPSLWVNGDVGSGLIMMAGDDDTVFFYASAFVAVTPLPH